MGAIFNLDLTNYKLYSGIVSHTLIQSSWKLDSRSTSALRYQYFQVVLLAIQDLSSYWQPYIS